MVEGRHIENLLLTINLHRSFYFSKSLHEEVKNVAGIRHVIQKEKQILKIVMLPYHSG